MTEFAFQMTPEVSDARETCSNCGSQKDTCASEPCRSPYSCCMRRSKRLSRLQSRRLCICIRHCGHAGSLRKTDMTSPKFQTSCHHMKAEPPASYHQLRASAALCVDGGLQAGS